MKKILNHLKADWYKYILELLVIMAGILGAYTLNNWNEERKEAIEEQEILNLLYDDFQNAKTQSEIFLAAESQDIWKLAAALGTAERVDSLFNLPNQRVIMSRVFWQFQQEVPVFRDYMDLKNSGKSSIIKSQDLRSELTQLEEIISALGLMLNDRGSVHTLRMDAMAVEDLNFLPLISKDNLNIVEGVATDYTELLSKQRIRNLIGIKLQMANTVLENRKKLDDQITKVLSAIKKEIK